MINSDCVVEMVGYKGGGREGGRKEGRDGEGMKGGRKGVIEVEVYKLMHFLGCPFQNINCGDIGLGTQCVPNSALCNGMVDCFTGVDETTTLCNREFLCTLNCIQSTVSLNQAVSNLNVAA